jgi:hypothetical protein
VLVPVADVCFVVSVEGVCSVVCRVFLLFLHMFFLVSVTCFRMLSVADVCFVVSVEGVCSVVCRVFLLFLRMFFLCLSNMFSFVDCRSSLFLSIECI